MVVDGGKAYSYGGKAYRNGGGKAYRNSGNGLPEEEEGSGQHGLGVLVGKGNYESGKTCSGPANVARRAWVDSPGGM